MKVPRGNKYLNQGFSGPTVDATSEWRVEPSLRLEPSRAESRSADEKLLRRGQTKPSTWEGRVGRAKNLLKDHRAYWKIGSKKGKR